MKFIISVYIYMLILKNAQSILQSVLLLQFDLYFNNDEHNYNLAWSKILRIPFYCYVLIFWCLEIMFLIRSALFNIALLQITQISLHHPISYQIVPKPQQF